MNTKKSLLISLVLVVGLLFAMLPGGKVEAATSVGTAAELTAALLTEETEITVTADISVGLVSGSAFVIPSGKTITLDLNGNEISAETSNGGVFGNAGTLTILDNSVDKGGKIINTNTTQTTTGEAAKSAISNTGVLIVNVGVIVAGPASGHGTWGDVNFNPAYGIDNLGGGQVTVNGATISGANGLRNFANGPDTKITINDGIVTGKTGIAMQSFGTNVGTLTINGDTIVTATRSAIYAAGVTQYNHIVINGGTFSGEDEYGTVCVVDGTLEINGGTFTGNNGTYSLLNYYAIVDVTAGTFNGDIWGGEFEPYEPYYEGIGLTTFAPSEGKCVTVDGEIGGNVVGEDLVNACHVHNMTQDTWHPTIQTAINEATAGDIIEVAAGTYVEQVTIDKSLSLIGAGELVTKIQAPATRTGTVVQGSTWDYIVAAYPTTGTIDVRIEGFTIDANSLPKQTGTAGLIGVFFRDVDGTTAGLFDSTVQRFEQVDYQSWGIRVYGDSALTIDGNILTGYTRDGITAIGDGGTGADPVVTISDNDLTGSALPLNGISILDGATGTVSGNTVRDHTRSAEWAAVGILVGDSENVQVSSNTVINSFYSIFLDSGADNNTVSGNTLTGTIKRGISLDKADNNIIKSNIINSLTIGTLDTAIGMDNDCANNVIGGELPADGNTITMATTGTGNLYAIYMQASVGANNNLIKNNTITGGARAVEFDGPPGITGSTTIANNVISGQSFGGILAYNNGDLIITGNSLTNTVRPMEFWGPVNLTVSGNTITGAVFDAINLGNVSGTTKLISGNTISGVAGNAIVGQPDADNFVIDGNTISTSNVGININTGCTGTIIRDNVIDDNIWSGISAYDALLTVTGNTITDSWRGIEILGALTAHQNIFTGNDYGSVIFYDNSAHNVTNNWWGSADGPGAWLSGVNVNTFNQGSQGDYIQANTYGNFVFAPWLDAAPPVGVSFAPVTNGTKSYGSIQAAIDDATDGDTILVCSGTYPGGLVVGPDNDNLTFELNGATVGAGSPAFTISGDNIVINGPGTLDGGTPGTDHAVLVSDGVSNFTINKVEIKNWVDGVHYAGEITNTQVVDCYIHDNTGDGVHFTTQPTVQTPVSFYIQGNMFKHNGGVGVYNAGTTTINTEYNSWSDYAGAAGLDDGDGAMNADTDPFTHVDLYLVSTNPAVDNWPHQVFVADTITYQVKAHLVNTTAAAFDLSYPTGLLGNATITYVTTLFDPVPAEPPLSYPLVDASVAGVIGFDGYTLTPVTGDVVLFEVTFTGLTPGTAALAFDDATDLFGMSPDYGPSVNIYADELVDEELDVIDQPTVTVTDGLDEPLVAGISREINTEICNPITGGEWIESVTEPIGPDAVAWFRISDVTIAEIASLQFLYEGEWYDFSVQNGVGGTAVQEVDGDVIARFSNYLIGFDIPLPSCVADAVRVTFVNPGTHEITIEIYDMMDTAYNGIDPDDILLTSYGPVTITVTGEFDVTGTVSMQGRSVRYDVPLTLTDINGAPVYGPYTTDSTSELAYNVLFQGVNGSIYEIATLQPRYLNVTADLDKQFLVNAAYLIDALELKGGNANWGDNVINLSDATLVGGVYGTGTIADAGDVNFDGKVNIQDLALVGGNFDLTSAVAYADWLVPEFNGKVAGVFDDDGTDIWGSVSGDYSLSIDGHFTGAGGGFAYFTGTVSGDFDGTVTGTVYERGTDPLYAIITETGAQETVRLVGAFVKSGIDGHFKGEIITGPELPVVTDVSITGPTTVAVGDTINLDVTTTPADRWVIWSVHANHTTYASIDQNGVVTGLQSRVDPIEIIVVVIDDSGFSTQSYWVTVTE